MWKIKTVENPPIQNISVPASGPSVNPIPPEASKNPITSSTLLGYKILIIAYAAVYMHALPYPISILPTIEIVTNKTVLCI